MLPCCFNRHDSARPPKHEGSVEDEKNRANLKYGKNVHNAAIGLQEFQQESVDSKPEHENIEAIGRSSMRLPSRPSKEGGGKNDHRGTLVELHRVPGNAVAEIPRPGQGRRCAVGEVAHAREEAADPPHSKAERQGQNEDSAGRAADAARQLENLDPKNAAEDRPEHTAADPRGARNDQIERAQPVGAQSSGNYQDRPIGSAAARIDREPNRLQIMAIEPPPSSAAPKGGQQIRQQMQTTGHGICQAASPMTS